MKDLHYQGTLNKLSTPCGNDGTAKTNILRWTQTKGMYFTIEGEGGETYTTPQGAGSFKYKIQTSPITNMCYMFGWCSGLTELDLSSVDVSNVTDMYFMFYMCVKLETLTLGSGFDMSNVTTYEEMFTDCTSLKTINAIGINDTTKTKLIDALQTAGLTSQVNLITE